MKLFVRNMVCDRCKRAVGGLLVQHGIAFRSVQLGEVELVQPLGSAQRIALEQGLEELGFELIDDQRVRTIERLKTLIQALVRANAMDRPKEKLSVHLARGMHMEYSGLSNLFSSVEGMTIERYHILQRLERAKELLVYDEQSLSRIAYELGYSSVHHLSNQFTQYVGHSPSHFKKIGAARRKSLDLVQQP